MTEAGLLGVTPSRRFKIFRSEFPAIFRFNGALFEEFYDIDANEHLWVQISEDEAQRWLKAKGPEDVPEDPPFTTGPDHAELYIRPHGLGDCWCGETHTSINHRVKEPEARKEDET
jgi:hypothetical protein